MMEHEKANLINMPSADVFSQCAVLVVGDVMLDRTWRGEVHRISPEAPVPVLKAAKMEAYPGGAANVALNIAALGATVGLMGVVGQDEAGEELASLLDAKKIQCHFEYHKQNPTTTKLRLLAQNQQMLRVDFEETTTISDHEALLSRFEVMIDAYQGVVLSDYAKGVLLNRASSFIEVTRARGKWVLVDPKSTDWSCYRGATLLTPNEKEFIAVVGACDSEAKMVEKAKQMIVQYHLEGLLVTRGKNGMLLVTRDGQSLSFQASAREVYDVTGAGDTVIGVLATFLAVGASLREAVECANLAAGLVVRKLGTATVSYGELYEEILGHALNRRVLTELQLREEVKRAQQQGLRIVMTNGCFDLLHPGHVRYLEAAKQLGDRLIVAVNDDDSVCRLKGASRPLNHIADRMEMLSHLRAVDWVVSFSEDTPARLIETILPDVLVKGGDYEVEQIAGYEAVLVNGGEVKILPFWDGYSTTNMVEKIEQTKNKREILC